MRALRALASDNHAIGQEAAGRIGARPSAGVARAYRRQGSADLPSPGNRRCERARATLAACSHNPITDAKYAAVYLARAYSWRTIGKHPMNTVSFLQPWLESEIVALCQPVVPIADGLLGGGIWSDRL